MNKGAMCNKVPQGTRPNHTTPKKNHFVYDMSVWNYWITKYVFIATHLLFF